MHTDQVNIGTYGGPLQEAYIGSAPGQATPARDIFQNGCYTLGPHAEAGLSVTEAQLFARHATPNLSMKAYACARSRA